MKTATLNASTLSNPDSLMLSLTSDMLPDMILKSLVDSRSSNSFIDSAFVQTHRLPTSGIPPIKLRLLDGTSNSVITQALDLQLNFPTRESQNLTFFVTPLDQGCTIVLGYRWLTHFNPMIDWVLGSIIFHQPSHHDSKTSPPTETLLLLAIPPVVVEIPLTLKFPDTPVPEILQSVLPVELQKLPRVTLINTAAYTCASKLKGSQCFQLHISSPETHGRSVTTSDLLVNMSTIPEDYHDFQVVLPRLD